MDNQTKPVTDRDFAQLMARITETEKEPDMSTEHKPDQILSWSKPMLTPTELRTWRLSQPAWPRREQHKLRGHLTQATLARLLGVHTQTVAGWESGRQSPAAYLQRALRDAERELHGEPPPTDWHTAKAERGEM